VLPKSFLALTFAPRKDGGALSPPNHFLVHKGLYQGACSYDEAAAKESVFGGLIVQGGVTSGLLNALVAQALPGPGTVFLGMELRFVKAA